MLTWNVYISNFNTREIEIYNIFKHGSFLEDCQKNYKKNKENKEEFLENLKKDLKYYYWSKCEWEILLYPWVSKDNDKGLKIDVYDQIKMNWEQFCDYVWNNKDEFKVSRRKK